MRGSGERRAVSTAPLILPPNQFHRFYAGGARIDALRGVRAGADGRPEDWIGSTTTAFGEASEGLSRVADGRLVRDLVRADPEALLGPEHVRRFGADPGLLVKLLDAGERLPVHLHPGRAFARAQLGSTLGQDRGLDHPRTPSPGATVHVGLREPVDAATLRRWVDDQDAGEMLAALHELPVQPAARCSCPPDAARDRRRDPAARAAGADRPLGPGRVAALRRALGRRAPPARLGRRARGDRPLPDRPGTARDRQPTAPGRCSRRAADPYFRAERVRPRGGEVESRAFVRRPRGDSRRGHAAQRARRRARAARRARRCSCRTPPARPRSPASSTRSAACRPIRPPGRERW